MFTVDDAFGKDIIDSVDNFDESNEDCFEAAAEYLHTLVQEFKNKQIKKYLKSKYYERTDYSNS